MAKTVLVAGHADEDVVDGPLRPVVAVWYVALVPAEPQRAETFVMFYTSCTVTSNILVYLKIEMN